MTLTQSIHGIRAVLFDVFGTVVDWRSSISQEVASFAKRCDSVVDGEVFADRWRALYQPAMERVRSGCIEFVPLDQLHRE
ncbi:MAG: haloacid dehalogenase type II, partial [Proteobacteria bacterium]|nr:haloacid dehalogenase type II [Pseudomonadota bacterium]